MRVHLYQPDGPPWDWRAPATRSQAHHAEVARRLARWGHRVESFVNLPADAPNPGPDGVVWRPAAEANPAVPDVWLVYSDAVRDPLPPVRDAAQFRLQVATAGVPPDLAGVDRWVAVWNANFHAGVGGTVVDEFAGHAYRRPNVFTFSHPWERASRDRWLRVGPGDVVLDIGSSVGAWALPAAACGATVYAFDPGSDSAMLRRLAAENGFGRIEVLSLFVSDAPGRVVPAADIHWSSVPDEGGGVGAAATTTVDDFVARRGLGRVDLIKVDVDGGEREVVRGMGETLKRFRPPVVVETHTFLGVQVDEVAGLLDGFGYDAVPHPMEEGYYYHVHGTPRSPA